MPGAFCDNFTSYGAVFRQNQTKLTHFLDHGAAMATGMVCEPYTIRSKIPSPFAHVHYVRGCTILESIYQTVQNPYEILIVGDPLCRPFADKPEFKVTGIDDGMAAKRIINLHMKEVVEGSIEVFEIYINGVKEGSVATGKPVRIETSSLASGFHELRVVAVNANNISNTQVFGFSLSHDVPKSALALEITNKSPLLNEELWIACQFATVVRVELWQNSRKIGEFPQDGKPLKIKSSDLGLGPTSIFAQASVQGKTVRGPSTKLVVKQLGKHRVRVE